MDQLLSFSVSNQTYSHTEILSLHLPTGQIKWSVGMDLAAPVIDLGLKPGFLGWNSWDLSLRQSPKQSLSGTMQL